MSEPIEDARHLSRRTTPTWEVELLISGVAVFAMLQLPGWLDDGIFALEPRLGEDWRQILILGYIYAKSAAMILATTFVLHLLLRARWIALVGMHSVYPEGILLDKLRLGPIQQKIEREINKPMQERIERVMGITLGREMDQLERYMTFLASVGSAAPFVGLFGTVWGIMNSFAAIAGSKNTSLAVVAPGIAEALFATALGLVAAIPAVLAYNKLNSDISRYGNRLDAFSGEFGAILSRQLEEKH